MTGVTDIADAPGIRKVIRNVIWSDVNRALVIPARIAIDLVDKDDFDMADCQFPPPIGVVRFTLHSAKNLKAMDTALIGSGKSDPFVVVTLGGGKGHRKRSGRRSILFGRKTTSVILPFTTSASSCT